MMRIFRYLGKKDRGIFAGAVVLIALQVWLDLRLPDYMSEITTLISTEGSAMSEVLSAGGRMLLCALAGLLLSVVVAVGAARVASDFSATVRKRLFDSVQRFSLAEINRFSTASLVTRTTNDVTQVQMLIVMGMMVIIRAPIIAVLAIRKISGKAWQWTGATAAAVVILLLFVILIVSITMPKFKRVQALTDDVNRVTRENLSGLKVVRAYNAERFEKEKFEKVNLELTRTHLFTGRSMAFMLPGIQIVMSGLSLSIYWIGAGLINQAGLLEKITVFSDMIVFSSYAMQILMAFMMLVMVFIIYPRASVAAKRILEVIETRPSIADPEQTGEPAGQGEVEFRHVSFRYPGDEGKTSSGKDVIHDITFRARQGETVALIGATGCGKSTIINMIPRFYDVTEGQVLVDGVDVRAYDQAMLRGKIGYVSQSALLFRGSISDNIAYGDNGRAPAGPETVRRAAQVAEAEEFISQLEGGYDAFVAQNGSNLSGGQRQRISIARAVAREPEILIFDDSFSALDYRTDRRVRTNLKEQCEKATKIIVAQRIGTIMDADRILVIDQGEIVGSGTHAQLLKDCSVYQEIAHSQLSKEELADA